MSFQLPSVSSNSIQKLPEAQAELQETKILILGAGPAGLYAAIRAIKLGYQPIVIEKRGENSESRQNAVALEKDTVALLEKEGIYQYLIDHRLAFSFNSEHLSVRLGDLEEAMKAVIATLTTHSVIAYDSSVKEILSNDPSQKAQVIIENASGETRKLRGMNFIINAEGAHSSTNELLGNRRIEVLPKIPVVAAIFKDTRPKITGFCSFFKYIGYSLIQTATVIYYYAIYLFRLIFQSESFLNSNRTIAGALILKTPDQNYLGFGFSKEKSQELMKLYHTVKQKRSDLAEVKQKGSDKEIQIAEQESREAQNTLESFVKYWAGVAFCEVNAFALLACLMCAKSPHFEFANWFDFDKFKITEIGADHAEKCAIQLGQTTCLVVGDALATVDPTTGLGCNKAIQFVANIEDFIQGTKSGFYDLNKLIEAYEHKCQNLIADIHRSSKNIREIYRPDALNLTHQI